MNKDNLAERFAEEIAKNNSNGAPNTPPTPPAISVMPVEFPAGDPEVIKARHEESLREYPDVKVDEDEFVVLSLRRTKLGLFGSVAVCLLIFIILVSAWILICFTPNRLEIADSMKDSLSMIFASLSVLTVVAGYIGYSVYRGNRLVITNERAIQWLVFGLMSNKRQTINLEATEDISYSQNGIFQNLFGYGTVRLSTTGDESTYTFNLVDNPAKAVEIIENLAEAARENQPVPDDVIEMARKMSVK
ncbi:MAG: PH domain-containing protein [bacterium]|nr:PH domain-containing protein [bacterium]